jgi:FkbM family methyltransferase
MPVDWLIGRLRQADVRGKGRVFGRLAARTGRRTVPVWGDYRMTLDLSDGLQRMMYLGCFGGYMTRCVRRLLGPGQTFLDVGAHAGYFTLLAAHRAGPTGRVVAVEPNPGMFAALTAHLRDNGLGRVRAEPIALGREPGVLTLYRPPAAENRPHNITSLPQPGWEPFEVPCRPLDAALAEWAVDRVEVMKVDVEGGEPAVLAGGRVALAAGVVRHVVCEFNGERLRDAGSSPADLLARFADLGFRPAELRGRRAVPVDPAGWDLHPDHEHDRLLVHRTVGG